MGLALHKRVGSHSENRVFGESKAKSNFFWIDMAWEFGEAWREGKKAKNDPLCFPSFRLELLEIFLTANLLRRREESPLVDKVARFSLFQLNPSPSWISWESLAEVLLRRIGNWMVVVGVFFLLNELYEINWKTREIVVNTLFRWKSFSLKRVSIVCLMKLECVLRIDCHSSLSLWLLDFESFHFGKYHRLFVWAFECFCFLECF